MIAWLVEQHIIEMGYGPETINWHTIVMTPSVTDEDLTQWARNAFHMAERIHREQVPPNPNWEQDWSFAFALEELEVAVKDYLWQAADGSSIAYEVRRLGEVEMDCTQGKVTFK